MCVVALYIVLVKMLFYDQAQDLKLMMSKLEHWAHRLYPNSTFNQFIERMEKLGTKKPVQVIYDH